MAAPRKTKAKAGKVTYKVQLPKAAVILRNKAKLELVTKEGDLLKRIVKGESYEAIADEYGLSTNAVFSMAKEAVDRWCRDLAFNAVEARQLDLMRLDAMINMFWSNMEPHEEVIKYKDEENEDRIRTIMTQPNRASAQLLLEVMDRRFKLLGTEAAQKLQVQGKIEHIRREYVGVDMDKL